VVSGTKNKIKGGATCVDLVVSILEQVLVKREGNWHKKELRELNEELARWAGCSQGEKYGKWME